MLSPQDDILGTMRRFVEKVHKSSSATYDGTPCWEWRGSLNSKGYPMLRVGKSVRCAHRVSFEMFFHAPGEHVHHKCLNPTCVNPLHLESTTAERNRQLQTLGVGSMKDLGDDVPF